MRKMMRSQDLEGKDWTANWNSLDQEAEEVDDPVDFDAGNVLEKLLALVNQVSAFF